MGRDVILETQRDTPSLIEHEDEIGNEVCGKNADYRRSVPPLHFYGYWAEVSGNMVRQYMRGW